MKKIVLLITAICLTSETFGQKTSSSSVAEYECIYEYQMKNDKGSSDATSTILQLAETQLCSLITLRFKQTQPLLAKRQNQRFKSSRHGKREMICFSTNQSLKMCLRAN